MFGGLRLVNLKVRTSLILVLVFFLCMLLAGAALGILSLRANNLALENLVSNQRIANQLTKAVESYKDTQIQLGRAAVSFVVNSDQQNQDVMQEWGATLAREELLSTDTQELLTLVRESLATARSDFSIYQREANSLSKRHEAIDRVDSAYVSLLNSGIAPLIDYLEQGQISDFRTYLTGTTKLLEDDMYSALGSLSRLQQSLIEQEYQKEAKQYQLVISLVGFAMALCLLIAFLVYVFLNRMVLRPLRVAGEHFDRIASGDLTKRIDVFSSNEIGVLYEAVRRMQLSLQRMVQTVREGVEEISLGSQEIFAGNTDLSSRTEDQAASLQETAASMEELSSTVRQNTDNAHEADRVAKGAAAVAQRGGEAVTKVIDTMEELSASSGQISQIVSVIDGIAFQTNILALNAAVEAARAGEQGKGFAVVAGEVRSLAQRSAQAAREIKGLIEESLSKVQAGTRQVDEAGEIMQDVVSAVQGVTTIMAEISSASSEQSEGIDQVNRAVIQMDGVVQQNAALVQQAAAAAGSLQEQASRLASAVAVFRINGNEVIDVPFDDEQLDHGSGSHTVPLTSYSGALASS